MFIKGFRFGLLLQLAVGPICLFVFNTAGNSGFASSSLASLAVTLVDGLYILLAGLGLAVFLHNQKVKRTVRVLGAVVLVLFGLDIMAGAFAQSYLPDFRFFQEGEGKGLFVKAALMTASNPLTIIFWGGALSSTVVSESISAKQLLPFGLGCVTATFVFLHGVALAGTLVSAFLPQTVMNVLNVCVGAGIIFFGLRMLTARKDP